MVSLPDVNWRILIECRDCGTQFSLPDSVSWSLEIIGPNRVAMVIVPQQCPECRNFKVVKEEEEESDA